MQKVFNAVRDLFGNDIAIHKAYRKVFDTDDGRAVLMHMFREFGMDGTTLVYDANRAVDPIASAHREGQRSVVMGILNTINADITPYIINMRKAHQAQEED